MDKAEITQKGNRIIFDNRSVDAVFFDMYKQDDIRRMSKILNAKTFKVGDLRQSYRTINSWSDAGLLNDNRENKKGWREFSLLDLFWIETVDTLRQKGLPISTIKNFHTKFFWGYENSTLEYPLFEIAIISVFYAKAAVSIEIADDDQVYLFIDNEMIPNDISAPVCVTKVDLNALVGKVSHLKQEDLLYVRKKLPTRLDLDRLERDLISVIRRGAVSGIKAVIKKDRGKGGIDRLELEQIESRDTNIRSILNRKGYQDVHITQEDGNVVRIKTIKKHK